MPGEEEALRLLEERKRVHIPDDSQRVIPSKKRETRKKKSGKERKRKRDFPSHGESAAKRASQDTIHTAVPLQARSAEGETSIPRPRLPSPIKARRRSGSRVQPQSRE